MAITPLMPVYPRSPVRPVRGEGVYLYGEGGEKYLDFASGIAVNLLGHGHPVLTKAVQDQAATLIHVSNLYGSPQGEAYAKRLTDLTFADTVFLTNSGAEAVEGAIKTARRYHHHHGRPEKNVLITFSNAFHGRTLGTISATDQAKLRDGFAPLLPGFTVVPFDDLDAARAAITDHVAGFLIEPVQGEGGIRPASQAFMQGLRDLADEHDLMLVLDEVQSGVGRTGKMWAIELAGVSPDILISAKGIASGLPLGAVAARAELMETWGAGAHGSTYGGSPVACAAGLATLQVIQEEGLVEHAATVGETLLAGLRDLHQQNPGLVSDVRGTGLMVGVEFVRPDQAEAVQHACFERGLLVLECGERTIRMSPPLVITPEQVQTGLRVLGEAMAAVGA